MIKLSDIMTKKNKKHIHNHYKPLSFWTFYAVLPKKNMQFSIVHDFPHSVGANSSDWQSMSSNPNSIVSCLWSLSPDRWRLSAEIDTTGPGPQLAPRLFAILTVYTFLRRWLAASGFGWNEHKSWRPDFRPTKGIISWDRTKYQPKTKRFGR